MTNQEKLLQVISKDVKENHLDNIQFYPGDTSTSSIDSFCKAITDLYEAEEQARFIEPEVL